MNQRDGGVEFFRECPAEKGVDEQEGDRCRDGEIEGGKRDERVCNVARERDEEVLRVPMGGLATLPVVTANARVSRRSFGGEIPCRRAK